MSRVTDFTSEGVIGESIQPKRYDIAIYQGDTFKFEILISSGATPIDLTGWTVIAQIRKINDTPGETPNINATLGGVNGKVSLSITNTGTGLLEDETYIYDVQITDNATPTPNVRTFIGGNVLVTKDISE